MSTKKLNAAILNIGTELLVGHVLNTHAQFLTKWLNHMGYSVHYHLSCGDNAERIQKALEFLSSHASLILVTGGLGPTQDDITRKEVANFLQVPLVRDPQVVAHIDNQFKQWGRVATSNNYLQADFPQGAVVLENPKGTAQGFAISKNQVTIACLPGPPVEVQAVTEGPLAAFLAGNHMSLYSQYLSIYGIGESSLDEMISDIFEVQTDPTLGIYAADGMLTLRLSTVKSSREAADAIIRPLVTKLGQRVGKYLISTQGASIPMAVVERLKAWGYTFAVAESCTGGLVSKLLTDLPGVSSVFSGGVVTYSNAAKVDLLGVSEETLQTHGAVSEAVAREMAQGARYKFGSDFALAITGIAGPEGGSQDKPVGMVCFALCGEGISDAGVISWTQQFPGDRNRVRLHAALSGLNRILQNAHML